jgi:hypothetical protein
MHRTGQREPSSQPGIGRLTSLGARPCCRHGF